MFIPESLQKVINAFAKKETISMEPVIKLPYLQLRKQLKAEIIKLTEDYKASHAYLGSTDYLQLRAKHIAYSMFRGKTFEQVEKSWKHPDSWINISVKKRAEELLANYQAKVERDVAHEEAIRSNP